MVKVTTKAKRATVVKLPAETIVLKKESALELGKDPLDYNSAYGSIEHLTFGTDDVVAIYKFDRFVKVNKKPICELVEL